MTELVEFLRARLDEDEHVAREAVPGPWVVIPDRDDFNFTITGKSNSAVVTSNDDGGIYEKRDAAHIARHDPARVLDDVEAKRRQITLAFARESLVDSELGCVHDAAQIEAGECPEANPDEIEELRALAAPYADHPGYRPEWGF